MSSHTWSMMLVNSQSKGSLTVKIYIIVVVEAVGTLDKNVFDVKLLTLKPSTLRQNNGGRIMAE